jgi:hypothetical protein
MLEVMAEARTGGSIRTAVAIAILCGGAGVAVTAAVRGAGSFATLLPVAAVLGAAALGLAARRWWGRWLGLAAGVSGVLYGGAVLLTMLRGGSVPDPEAWALAAGPLLLACLTGRTMFDRFDRPAGRPDHGRARLVRWAVITNVASLSTLLLVSYALYDIRSEHDVRDLPSIWAGLLAVGFVLAGVLLLARGKTAGLFASVVGIAAQALMLFRLLRLNGYVVTALLLPGLLLATASVIAYAAPMWRFVRGR